MRLHPGVPKIQKLLAGEASRVQNSELATESIGFPSEQSATLFVGTETEMSRTVDVCLSVLRFSLSATEVG